jgi:hypothetical protein
MTTAMGAEQFAAMQAALTVPPLHTCVRVNTLRTTPEVCRHAMCVCGGLWVCEVNHTAQLHLFAEAYTVCV